MSNDAPDGGKPATPEFERIAPISLELACPQDKPRRARSAIPGMLMGVVLGVLLTAAAGVFFLLPKRMQNQALDSLGAQTAIAPAPTLSTAGESTPLAQAQTDPSAELAPLRQAQLKRAREEAENALAILMQKQAKLKEQGVDSWGGQRFAVAKHRAAAGDESFLNQDYKAAAEAYTQSGKILDELIGQADGVLRAAVKAGLAALADGDADKAAEEFKLALAIDPNNTQAKKGLIRAGNLDQVHQLLSTGAQHEAQGTLQAALRAYQEALRLDPESKPAHNAVNKITHKITEYKFNRAMSEGFAALEDKDFEAARQAFRKARELKPDSAAVADGLAQVDLGIRLQKIAAHKHQAARLERQEDWQRAAKHYRAALKLDPNLAFAKEGEMRAAARARLAQQLDFHIKHPKRLSSDDVYAQAFFARNRASEIENKGPRLREQLAELSELLRLAATPVRVRLESDNLTEVVVYKVGELGTFDARALKLRPGEYTAVGSRDGYRDVRREFTVVAGETPMPVVVRCEERI